MAGGPLANIVTCLVCLGDGKLTKAARTYEGDESDGYLCDKGHDFSIDWRGKPATEAQWPPSRELIDAMKS
jgi:hypothetical protein